MLRGALGQHRHHGPSSQRCPQLAQLLFQEIEIDRLRDEIGSAMISSATAALVVAIGGYHHDREIREPLLDLLQTASARSCRAGWSSRRDQDIPRWELAGKPGEIIQTCGSGSGSFDSARRVRAAVLAIWLNRAGPFASPDFRPAIRCLCFVRSTLGGFYTKPSPDSRRSRWRSYQCVSGSGSEAARASRSIAARASVKNTSSPHWPMPKFTATQTSRTLSSV